MIVRAGHGRGQERRPAPQRRVLSRVGPLPRADRRRPLQSGRRQGAVQDGPAGQRSGALSGTQVAACPSKGPVPVGEHYIPFGQANVVRQGTDLTIVSCGLWLRRSLEAAEQLAAQGISCEVIDLRTIVPLDVETIVASVAKTGRLLVVDEAYAMCGIGAEIAAVVMEHAFDELDAPVGRLHTEPVSQPFSPALEDAVVASVEKIVAAAARRARGPAADPAARRGHARARRSAPPRPQRRRPHDVARRCGRQRTAAAAPPAAESRRRRRRQDGVPVIMPNMDLIITEATVVAWLKKVGDTVRKGEALVEIETDKAVTQVESPADGVLAEILADAGTVVPLGQQLGTITP